MRLSAPRITSRTRRRIGSAGLPANHLSAPGSVGIEKMVPAGVTPAGRRSRLALVRAEEPEHRSLRICNKGKATAREVLRRNHFLRAQADRLLERLVHVRDAEVDRPV